MPNIVYNLPGEDDDLFGIMNYFIAPPATEII